MADGKPKGDIRDLYAYYRFSDHTLTNIVLKDKSLFKNDVWFEGFMDWGFTNCTFNKSFYFGVEGEKLEEDTRGTGENPEPFPPYGSNGLNFDACTFTEPFEIKDNCVVVFKECTFTETFTIEDSVRVEFIECTFTKGVTFKTFCEVRFIRCTLAMSDFGIEAADHCTFYFNDCSYGTPDEDFFWFDNDCSATFHGKEKTSISTDYTVFKVSNDSHVKVYNFAAITNEKERHLVDVSANSKIEFFDTTSLYAEKADIFNIIDSQLIMQRVDSCGCGGGRPVYAENSQIRISNMDLMVSGTSPTIEISDSKLSISDVTLIHSDLENAVRATNSEVNISTSDKIDSAQGITVYLTGTTVALFRDVDSIEAGQKIAVYIDNGAWGQFKNVTTITSGESTAIDVTDGRYTDDIGTLRQGKTYAVDSTNSLLEATDVVEFVSTELCGIQLEDCAYDFRNITQIHGKMHAFLGANCKGVLFNVATMESGEDVAVRTTGCSGPLEWDTIELITSSLLTAWEVSGDLQGFRACKIQRIFSEQELALSWNQTSGDAYLYDIGTIESEQQVAANITVDGRFRLEKITSIVSKEEKALVLSVAEGAQAQISDFDSISSEMETAVSGTSQGDLAITNGTTIESQEGSVVLLDGGGALYSSIRLADIATLKSDQLEDNLVGITSCSFVQLHKIASFEMGTGGDSSYIAYLRGNGGDFGRCEVIDCPSFTATKGRGGLYLRDFFDFDVICSREKGSIVMDEATGILFGILSCNGRVANFSEITDTSHKAVTGLLIYGLIGAVPGNVKIWNIGSIEAKDTAVNIATYGRVEMYNVGEIKTPEGSPAMRISNGQVLIQGGSTATKLTAKDTSSKALEVIGTSDLTLINIETEGSKGKFTCSDARVVIHKSKINGDFEVSSCTGEAHDTEFNTSVKLTSSRIEFYNSPVALASQAGEAQDFDIDSSSSAYLFNSPISGSGEVKGEGVLHGDVENITPKVSGSGVVLLNKGTSGEVDVSGVVLFNDVSVSGAMTLGGDGAGLINKGTISGALTTSTSVGAILNAASVDGAINLGDKTGLILNSFTGVGLTTTSKNGCILNSVDFGNDTIEVDATSGMLAARLQTRAGNVGGALVGAAIESNQGISTTGSVVSAGKTLNVNTSSSGSAVMVGGVAGGDGAGISVLGYELANLFATGSGAPRTGIRVYTNVLQLWNENGSTEGGGAGTSMVLGVTAGSVGDGYSLDPKSQVRSASSKIYDIASEIHHNLPEPWIPD